MSGCLPECIVISRIKFPGYRHCRVADLIVCSIAYAAYGIREPGKRYMVPYKWRMKMKAYVLEGIGELVYKEVPTPQLREDEVLVEVVNAGICGSDIPRIFQTGTYHFPTIPGHEFAGIVREAAGEKNASLVGKRAGVFPLIPCMQCEPCREKAYEMCRSYNYLGSRTDGGFAQYVAVPAWNLIELPPEVSFEDAAMLEPACVALHAIRQAHMEGVTSAAVYGCGTIGTLIVQWLAAMGIRQLYVIGTREEQHRLVSGFAACTFCNCREEDPVFFVTEQTEGRGVDIAFECVGVKESVNNAVASVRAGGQIVFVGNPAGDIALDKQIYWQILRRQLTIYGTWNSSFTKEEDDDWHRTVRAIREGRIAPARQITRRFSLDRLPEGLAVMQDKTVFTNKVMIGAV